MSSTLSISKPPVRKSSLGRGKAAIAISAPLENALLGGVETLDPASPRAQQTLPADVRFPPTKILPWSQPLAVGRKKSASPLERVPSFVPSHPYARAGGARQLPSPATSHTRSASLPDSPQVDHQFGIALGVPGRLSVPPSPTSPDGVEPKRRRRPPTGRIGENVEMQGRDAAKPREATSEGVIGGLAAEASRAPWASVSDGGRPGPSTATSHSNIDPPSSYHDTSRDSPFPFAQLLPNSSVSRLATTSTPSPNPSHSASNANPIKHGVGSDFTQRFGGAPMDSSRPNEKRKAASQQSQRRGKAKGAPSVVEEQEVLLELPDVVKLLAGGPRFSVGTLLHDFDELAKADKRETLQQAYIDTRPSLPSGSTLSATSSEVIESTVSQAWTDPSHSTQTDPPHSTQQVSSSKTGFFSLFRRTKRAANRLPSPTPVATALADDSRLTDADSARSRNSRLRNSNKSASQNQESSSPGRLRTKSVTTSSVRPFIFHDRVHLRRTSSFPPLPSLKREDTLAPPIEQIPSPSSPTSPAHILQLPIERRVRAERMLWKEREGNQTKAARVADWLQKVAPVEGAPPSPLSNSNSQHQRTSSFDVDELSPAMANLSSSLSRPRSSADLLPPRPPFANSSPASSLPHSPDGTPTLIRRDGRILDQTSGSLDLPRTPTDTYDYSNARIHASPFPPSPIRPFARGVASTPTPPPSSPFPLRNFPPPPPKKPFRRPLPIIPHRQGTSLDSLIDPPLSHLDSSTPPSAASSRYSELAAPPSIEAGPQAPWSYPPPLSKSQESGFTLLSVEDDTLFFTKPRGHPPSRPAPLHLGAHQQRNALNRPSPLVGRVDIVTQGVAQLGVRRTGSLVKTSSLSRKCSTRSTADSLIDPVLGSVEGSVIGGRSRGE